MSKNNDKAMRLLEQLTPQGSEFHNDPQRCFDWVKESRDDRWAIIKRQVKEMRENEVIISNLRRLLLGRPKITNCNTPGYVEWWNRVEGLLK